MGFLVLVVAVKIGRYAAPIYPTPFKGVEIGILGDLALFNIAVLVLMLERRIRETGFGFLPTGNDWRIGAPELPLFPAHRRRPRLPAEGRTPGHTIGSAETDRSTSWPSCLY